MGTNYDTDEHVFDLPGGQQICVVVPRVPLVVDAENAAQARAIKHALHLASNAYATLADSLTPRPKNG